MKLTKSAYYFKQDPLRLPASLSRVQGNSHRWASSVGSKRRTRSAGPTPRYPSIKNSIIENKVVHGQTKRRGIIVSCLPGGGRNRIVQNTVVDDAPLTIWNGDGELVANNILVAGEDEAILFEFGWAYYRHGSGGAVPDLWLLPTRTP